MNDNHKQLQQRALQAAEEALYKKQYVSPIDVFLGMGWLKPVQVDDWIKGRIPYLESVIQVNLHKISFCMECFRAWAEGKNLKANLTAYFARTKGPKRELRFSKSGTPEIERAYRTHYISPELSEKKKQKLQEKLEKPPELVVFRIIQNSQCSQCKKELPKGSLLYLEKDTPLCLSCSEMDDLEYLPRGNAKLTRLVKKESAKHAIVVEFSRTRKRYERQGILVDVETLEKVQKELGIESYSCTDLFEENVEVSELDYMQKLVYDDIGRTR